MRSVNAIVQLDKRVFQRLFQSSETALWNLASQAMNRSIDLQKDFSSLVGADYLECDPNLKVGINKSFDRSAFPINGLRHLPTETTTGWYIWSGQQFSMEADFFVPLHASHIPERCPEILKYLGLRPGWRFLYAPTQEDVWFDPSLLNI
jgi:hypothetical protein